MIFLLKWKIWHIETGLKSLLEKTGVKPMVWSFGAFDIDPKHLVFVVGVPTDEEKNNLKVDSLLAEQMQFLLEKYNWPIAARKHVVFDIESQETVDRETNGNWWHHYK
jgi:hypothetical protein